MMVATGRAAIAVGIDPVGEDVGCRRLLGLEEVVALTEVAVGGQLAVRIGQERARGREHAVAAVLGLCEKAASSISCVA